MEEQYIYNYLALTACLISKKPPNTTEVNYIIRVTTGQNVSSKGVHKRNGNKVILIDTFTNEKTEFESQGDASKYLGMNRNTAGRYVNTGRIYKKRYIFKSA